MRPSSRKVTPLLCPRVRHLEKNLASPFSTPCTPIGGSKYCFGIWDRSEASRQRLNRPLLEWRGFADHFIGSASSSSIPLGSASRIHAWCDRDPIPRAVSTFCLLFSSGLLSARSRTFGRDDLSDDHDSRQEQFWKKIAEPYGVGLRQPDLADRHQPPGPGEEYAERNEKPERSRLTNGKGAPKVNKPGAEIHAGHEAMHVVEPR